MQSAPDSSSDGNADLLRGILIAAGLLVLSVGAFLLVASHGRVRASEVFERVVSFVAPSPAPAPKPARKAPEHASAGTMAPLANPSAGAGLADPGAAGADGSGGGNARGGAPASSGGAPVGTAAQALRNVLRDFRADPRRTASITISSNGRVTGAAEGPLTHDGQPMEAMNGATLITGSAPSGGAP
jgi:hypothetical protein